MSDLDNKLLLRAAEVRQQAYAPYSNYAVGAALHRKMHVVGQLG